MTKTGDLNTTEYFTLACIRLFAKVVSWKWSYVWKKKKHRCYFMEVIYSKFTFDDESRWLNKTEKLTLMNQHERVFEKTHFSMSQLLIICHIYLMFFFCMVLMSLATLAVTPAVAHAVTPAALNVSAFIFFSIHDILNILRKKPYYYCLQFLNHFNTQCPEFVPKLNNNYTQLFN